MDIKKWLKENLERRPYNDARVSDGKFNYYHQEDVIDLIEGFEKSCNKVNPTDKMPCLMCSQESNENPYHTYCGRCGRAFNR